jgi:hypothetical protein
MTTTVTIALDARTDLSQAGMTLNYSAAWHEADDRDDIDTLMRLEADNDRLVEAFEAVYRTVAERVGRDTFDADVTVIDYDPAAGNTGDPLYDEDGQPTLAGLIWQEAHDETGVEIHPDGTWTIRSICGPVGVIKVKS